VVPRRVQMTLRNPRERVEKVAMASLLYLCLVAVLRIFGVLIRTDMPVW
jgi:hypothetical protein